MTNVWLSPLVRYSAVLLVILAVGVIVWPDGLRIIMNSDDFMPHGHCYMWEPGLLQLHLISDSLIALAYTSIPFTLIYFVRNRHDLPFNWMFLCFGAFIIACGATHALEVWTLWTPTYWLSGIVKAITAIVSVTTAILLVRLVPTALALPSPSAFATSTENLAVANETLKNEITQRMRTEEALRASESRLAGILNTADDAIISIDANQHIKLFNQGAERIFQYSDSEVINQPLELLLPLRFASIHRQHVVEFGNSPDVSRAMGQRREIHGRRKDGAEFSAEATISKLKLGDEISFTVMLRDITDRKNLEEQLRQAQKMEAIGRLAGGIAHDFNNLLTAIIGYSQVAMSRLDSSDSVYSAIEQVDKAAQRAATLTSQLLAFSRRQILQPKLLDLNDVVNDMNRMLQRLIGEDVKLVTVVQPSLGTVMADPGQIEQVIVNLAVNARDAMPQGGKLTIETANVELDENYTRTHAQVEPGSYIMLAVSDTGSGMDVETMSKIFEPFFTTKEVGRGTGLGLSTVYGIIKQSGGHIWVYSEPGQGTSFKIYLPRVEGMPEMLGLDAGHLTLMRGSETILLVEDEEAVRKLAREILEMNGYTVLEASNGDDALRMAHDPENKIDLLLTDVVMPDTSGKELANQLGITMPHIKVLYMSGYTDNTIIHHGVLDAGIAFLQKPFTPSSLARKVRAVLDDPGKNPDKDESA